MLNQNDSLNGLAIDGEEKKRHKVNEDLRRENKMFRDENTGEKQEHNLNLTTEGRNKYQSNLNNKPRQNLIQMENPSNTNDERLKQQKRYINELKNGEKTLIVRWHQDVISFSFLYFCFIFF